MPIARYPLTIDGDTWEVGTAAELAVALDVLQGRHDRAVLEQLAPHLPAIVTAASGLMALFRGLATPDRLYLLEALGPHLAGVIGSAAALRDLLATLAEVEVEECLLATLGAEGLARLVQSAEELAEVLEWVYGACDRQVLDLLGLPRLRGLLANGSDLSLVLHSLSPVHQSWLLDALGWEQVAALVLTRQDLTLLLRALPGALSRRLLEYLPSPRLAALVGNARGWEYLSARLEADEIAALTRRIQEADHAT
ncbi:MAG: hypothetical protein ACYC4R_02215 [Anaerolineae bacterium]